MPAPFHILIPARYAATRLPGKPLIDLGGQPLVARVVECARRSAAASVTVATDDARIAAAVAAIDADVVMTGDHPSGTDRIDEAAELLGLAPDAVIVNLQGDEPRMPAALIEQVAARLAGDARAAMATAAAPLDSPAQLADPAVVKVVTDRAGYALYFSRAAIPWGGDSAAGDGDGDVGDGVGDGDVGDGAGDGDVGDGAGGINSRHPRASLSGAGAGAGDGDGDAGDGVGDGDAGAGVGAALTPRRHIGLYAYRRAYLRRFAQYGACQLERRERLEQLRALWHGDAIACAPAVAAPPAGVDTAADVARVRALFATPRGQNRL